MVKQSKPEPIVQFVKRELRKSSLRRPTDTSKEEQRSSFVTRDQKITMIEKKASLILKRVERDRIKSGRFVGEVIVDEKRGWWATSKTGGRLRWVCRFGCITLSNVKLSSSDLPMMHRLGILNKQEFQFLSLYKSIMTHGSIVDVARSFVRILTLYNFTLEQKTRVRNLILSFSGLLDSLIDKAYKLI